MWRCYAFALTVLTVMPACSSKQEQGGGLPPAQEWGADPGQLQPAPQTKNAGPHAADPANPHAGMDMNNPHAGLDMGGGDPSNPHAGLDMGGGDPSNPHAGLDMSGGGADVGKLGLPPPDPNRAIDPNHHIKGTILVHPKAADRAKPGTAVYVVVKKADASGQPTGTPLAVEKLTWQKDQLPFEMTERQAMIAGTELTGDVVISAHYDQDGDAISKQPGDILGQLRVTIPADNVKLYLDQVLP